MELPKRKSPRLQGFDYSSENYYFVTVCTHKKTCIFGSLNGENQLGKIVEKTLLQIPEHFNAVAVKKYVVMPNHVHAVISIGNGGDASDLTRIIGQFKSSATREIHKHLPNIKVWQASFYDHVIRGEEEFFRVCKYIDENASKLKCLISGDV